MKGLKKHNGKHENHNKRQRMLATKSSATTTFKAIGSLRPILQIPRFPGGGGGVTFKLTAFSANDTAKQRTARRPNSPTLQR